MISKGKIFQGFIVLFISLLLFPNTGLFREKVNAEIVARENRKITAFPKETWKAKSFYSNFEKWYQDRLRYRDKAIKFWKETNFKFGVVLSDNIFLGKSKWLFSRGNVIKTFKYKENKGINLKKIQDYCQNRGIQFAFLLAPPKEAVYMDYFPNTERQKYKEYAFWEQQVIEEMQRCNVNYLSVTKYFEDARNSNSKPLYFPDDHHWSYYGAAIASDLLLKQFSSEGKWYTALPLNTTKQGVFKECSYANNLGFGKTRKIDCPWSSSFTDEIYSENCYSDTESKLKEIPSNNMLWGKIVNGEGIIKNKKIRNGKTILILGDSYSSYMVPYLSQYVSTVVSTHYRDCADRKKEVDLKRLIDQYKPDYVMLEMVGNAFYASNDKDRIGKIILK